MAIIAKVKKTVVLNAGGTVLIDPTDPYDQYTDYQFTGTGDLLANYAIAPTGTIAHSYKVRIIWAATMGLNGNTVTIFSKVLSAQQAGSGAVVIEALYNMVTSSWIVTVMDSTTFGPQTYEGSDNHVLDVAGGVLTLVPGTNRQRLILIKIIGRCNHLYHHVLILKRTVFIRNTSISPEQVP